MPFLNPENIDSASKLTRVCESSGADLKHQSISKPPDNITPSVAILAPYVADSYMDQQFAMDGLYKCKACDVHITARIS